MKFKYNKKDDVLVIELSQKSIDYGEQTRGLIIHFSKDGEAVELEILDATKFLKEIAAVLPTDIKKEIFPLSSASTAKHIPPTAVSHRIK